MEEIISPEVEKPTVPTPWTFWDVVLIGSGVVLIFLVAILAVRQVVVMGTFNSLPAETTTIWASIAAGALEGVALIGSIYLLGLRRRRLGWEAVGLRGTTRNWWLNAGLLGILVIPLSGLIALIVQFLLGQPLENPQLDFLAPGGFSWVGMIGMFVMGGLVAPLAEEMFFRGVLYSWLRRRWGAWAGILVSGIIFGIAHGEVSVGAAAAVLGFLLAWVYERSTSLWPCVIIHVINNGVKIIFLYILLAIDPSLLG